MKHSSAFITAPDEDETWWTGVSIYLCNTVRKLKGRTHYYGHLQVVPLLLGSWTRGYHIPPSMKSLASLSDRDSSEKFLLPKLRKLFFVYLDLFFLKNIYSINIFQSDQPLRRSRKRRERDSFSPCCLVCLSMRIWILHFCWWLLQVYLLLGRRLNGWKPRMNSFCFLRGRLKRHISTLIIMSFVLLHLRIKYWRLHFSFLFE